MQFLQQLKIKLTSKFVGTDEFGNSYYENRLGQRFIVYKGEPEPSKIPAEWHGWIHYTTNVAPVNINTRKHSWQKIHLPNLTGTKNAYSPKNSPSHSRKPYQAWHPGS